MAENEELQEELLDEELEDDEEEEEEVRQKILVADDEASIRRILETRLKMVGYDVVVAEDGEEGDDQNADNGQDGALVAAEANGSVLEKAHRLALELGVHDLLLQLDQPELFGVDMGIVFGSIKLHAFLPPIRMRGSTMP